VIQGRRLHVEYLPFLLLLITAWFSGCSMFRMVRVSVTAWSPAESTVEELASCAVTLTFSAGMDKVSVEESFSLSAEGEAVPGTYAWDDRTMTFTPFLPLDRRSEYTMALLKTAEDKYGNNLEADFIHVFSGARERDRPLLLSATPEDGSMVDDPYRQIILEFSESLDRVSMYENFSISPDPEGTFSWNGNDSVCTFTPDRSMTAGEEYTVTLGADVSDRYGNTMGTEHMFAFSIGADTGAPDITAITSNEQPSFVLAADDPGDSIMTVTAGWECFWNIRAVFSEEIDIAVLETGITLKPAVEYTLEELSDKVFLLRFDRLPVYDTLYSLTFDAAISDTSGNSMGQKRTYLFKSDGPGSLPPSVELVRFSGNTSTAGTLTNLQHFDNLSLRSGLGATDEYFDIYVRTAEGAAIEKKTFIEHFSISSSNTAGCFSISLFGVELSPAAPAPDPAPEADQQVIRVHASMETFTDPGIMTLEMESGFADSLGNPMDGGWTMQVNVINS